MKFSAIDGSEWRIHWQGHYPIYSGWHDKFEGTNEEFEKHVHNTMEEFGWRHAIIEHDANGRFEAWWKGDHVHFTDED